MSLIAGLSPTITAEELKFSLAADADSRELGSGFASAGDVNGDGTPDIAVADRSAVVSSFLGSGLVHIVSGTDGALIRNYVGIPAESQNFGSALVSLKADDDEIPDLAVGSQGGIGGGVRVYAGADGSLISSSFGPTGSQLGSSIANAGDLNADGFDDLYVGAPTFRSSPTSSPAGGVFVISGRDGSTLTQINGVGSLSEFGSSIVTLGDIDGDGKNEIAVGSPGYKKVIPQLGRVQIFRGSDYTPVVEILGVEYYNRLGESLVGVSDSNGDEKPDLLVGSFSGGVAQLVSGADLTTLKDLTIATLPDYQPMTVGGGLDFDDDGTEDWLIGSPALQTVGADAVGGIRVVSGLDQSTLFEFTAAAPMSGLGLSMGVLPGLGFAAGESGVEDAISHGTGLAHIWGVAQVQPILDADADGVLDDVDKVPQSIMDPTVVILGVDSEVENRVDSEGVTLADRFAELGKLSDYRVRARYFVKALHLATKLRRAELVTKREGRRLAAAALEGILRAKRDAKTNKGKLKDLFDTW